MATVLSNNLAGPMIVTADTSTAYTLVLTDNVVTMTNASANVLTIPTNASVAFGVNGVAITVWMVGAGVTTITADTGVTLNGVSAGSGVMSNIYGAVALMKIATDTWIMTGSHAAVA